MPVTRDRQQCSAHSTQDFLLKSTNPHIIARLFPKIIAQVKSENALKYALINARKWDNIYKKEGRIETTQLHYDVIYSPFPLLHHDSPPPLQNKQMHTHVECSPPVQVLHSPPTTTHETPIPSRGSHGKACATPTRTATPPFTRAPLHNRSRNTHTLAAHAAPPPSGRQSKRRSSHHNTAA